MRRLLLADIDGVIADCSHRLHFQKAKDYDAFYSADNMLRDEVIVKGRDLVRLLLNTGYAERVDLVLLTGRPNRTRVATEAWLDHNAHIYSFEDMIMRHDGDYRPSNIIKLENFYNWLLEKHVMRSRYNKRELNKFTKLPLEEKVKIMMEYYDEPVYIDDDPKNVEAIASMFPMMSCLTFGVERFS